MACNTNGNQQRQPWGMPHTEDLLQDPTLLSIAEANSTDLVAAQLDHILATMKKLETWLDETDRRVGVIRGSPQPDPDPDPDPPYGSGPTLTEPGSYAQPCNSYVAHHAQQGNYQPPSPQYQPATMFQQPHAAQLSQQFLPPPQPYHPLAPLPDDLQRRQPLQSYFQHSFANLHPDILPQVTSQNPNVSQDPPSMFPLPLASQHRQHTCWDLPGQRQSWGMTAYDQPPLQHHQSPSGYGLELTSDPG